MYHGIDQSTDVQIISIEVHLASENGRSETGFQILSGRICE